MSERVPAEVFPPGEYLKDELDAREWTQAEFAEIIGRSTRLINEIIAGKRAITPVTAKEIGAALDTSPLFWLNLETAYQLNSKKDESVSPKIAENAKLRERFPVREMIKRGWLENSSNPELLKAQCLKFFRVEHIDERAPFARAARQTSYTADLTPVQEAWLFRTQQLAEALPVSTYSEEALRKTLNDLRSLMNAPEDARHVPRFLGECGVRYVIVEPLPASKIDGVCFWLNKKAPVIGMSLRFDRIDNFWFVLRHEIEHVLRRDGFRDGVTAAIVDSELDTAVQQADLPEEERIANTAAREYCVPVAEMDDFLARVYPLLTEERVLSFAARLGVHPGIVVGQLQKRLEKYSMFRKYLAKVREVVTPSAMTDGYGQAVAISL
jgi:HTH-type transcriptional regulator/antitoxin HigA